MPNTNPSDLDREAPDAVTNPSPPTNAGILRGWADIMETGGFSDPEDIPWLVKHLRAAADELSALPRASGVPEAEAVAWVPKTSIERLRQFPGQSAIMYGRKSEKFISVPLFASPPPVAVPEAEAVAWQIDVVGDIIGYSANKKQVAEFAKNGHKITPLYAAPPPVAAPSGEPEEHPCYGGCQYAKDIGMWPQHACVGECIYERDAALPPSPIASEPKDAGSGEGQLSREEQAIAIYDTFMSIRSVEVALEKVDILEGKGYRIVRTAPSGAKP